MSEVRAVSSVLVGEFSVDGAGVRLRRSIGSQALPLLDPFLLLDEIHSQTPAEYLKGFPSHPHRGFETVTYMIEGAMQHRDSVGNHGRLGGGSAQWMTAGRGIVHSEMPSAEESSLWGLQLWVNLPRRDKFVRPRYQDVQPQRIPEFSAQGAQVRLVAGAIEKQRGPVSEIAVDPTLADISLPARGRFEHDVAREHTVFAYVLSGSVRFAHQANPLTAGSLAVFGTGAVVGANSEGGGRFLLISGRPLYEPVARRGPFVMNTDAELQQAFEDYQSGRLVEG
ncbi:MAG TPA: pirin family protein [Polyangiaceae bacterium]|nr:pirin family protein [Polyangiaceae bacterium]